MECENQWGLWKVPHSPWVPQHRPAEPPSEMGKSAENPAPPPFLFRTSFLQATTYQDFSGTLTVRSACRGKCPLAVCWEPRASSGQTVGRWTTDSRSVL